MSLQTGENFLKFDCCLAYSASTLSGVKRTRRVRQMKLSVLAKRVMKLSVLAEYAQLTAVYTSKNLRRVRAMKLCVLGEYAEKN